MLFQPFTNDAFLHALMWMLIHSFWQGLIAAALAGLVMLITRNLSSALRYNMLVLTGCLFIVVVAYTFLLVYQDFKDSEIGIQVIQTILVHHAPGDLSKVGGIGNQTNWFSSFFYFVNQYESPILWFWLAVLVFKSIRLVIGYNHIMNLRKKEILSINSYWQKRIIELKNEAGVQSTVHIFQSGLAKIPLVIGFFKPVILVPLGFFACMPPEEIEAILVHELAHIRRRDYLVNMIQNIVEIVFFFNTPVLWISSTIRKERENCCDDIAIAFAGNKVRYINALVAFNESNITSRFATSFGGNNTMPLLDRIKRITYHKNKTLNQMEKISLITGVLVISFLGYAFNQKAIHKTLRDQNYSFQTATKKMPLNTEPGNIMENEGQIDVVNDQQIITKSENHLFAHVTDTIGKGKTEIKSEIEGIKYRLVFVQDKLVELYKDGVLVPEDKFSEYDSIIQKVIADRKKAEEYARKAQAHEKKAQANALSTQEHQKNEQANALMAQEHAQQAQAMEKEVQVKTTESQAMAIEAEKQIALANQHQQQSVQFARNAEANALEAGVHAKYAQLHSSIYKEFLKDGLIKEDDQHFNYNIREGKLFINGEEQSPAVFQKYNQLINELKQSLGIQ